MEVNTQDNILKVERLPDHVAIIMDGNGRWAQRKGKTRTFGHENGLEAVRSTIEGAAEMGIKFLTLYTFSMENWKRPKEEIDLLMALFVQAIHDELPKLMKNRIRLLAIGEFSLLPDECRNMLYEAMRKTADNDGLTLILALSYSARWEITEMTRKIAQKVDNREMKPENIDAKTISEHLSTATIPDPNILIRTGGEYRLSNFLLWQMAYTELFFVNKMWPDFRKKDLKAVILKYQSRELRFGKISEQLTQF